MSEMISSPRGLPDFLEYPMNLIPPSEKTAADFAKVECLLPEANGSVHIRSATRLLSDFSLLAS